MSARLYVGNIPFKSTEQDLRDHFAQIGPVLKVDVVIERDTGRPRGFAFVEMEDADAHRAIEQLGGANFGGRALTVNAAKERAQREMPKWRDDKPRGGGRERSRNRDW